MKNKLLSLAASVVLLGIPLYAQESHHHEGMTLGGNDLGSVNFPISCAAGTQQIFTRGVALLYSFEYEQAQQSFASVAQKDPACAMAYWGQGMSLWHQLWERPSKAALQQGSDFLQKASALKSTAREHDYIEALAIFYRDPGLDHDQRAEAYCKAMKGVTERNAQDREAQVFYALALLASAPENDAEHKNERAAVAILNQLFEEQPRHPGIAHYIIHACDNPQMASLALPAAQVCADRPRFRPRRPHAFAYLCPPRPVAGRYPVQPPRHPNRRPAGLHARSHHPSQSALHGFSRIRLPADRRRLQRQKAGGRSRRHEGHAGRRRLHAGLYAGFAVDFSCRVRH